MTDGITFTRAIVCPPADSYASGLTTALLGAPDLVVARAQHATYCTALKRLGVEIITLPPDRAHPDSTFVEDTAVVTAHGAMLTRPGASSRRGETAAMHDALAAIYDAVDTMTAPGTLDGGDVCEAGSHFFVGLSARTNEAGAAALTAWLEGQGCTASTIDIRGDAGLLHLKSGLAWLDGKQLVAVSEVAGDPALVGFDVLVVPDDEAYAANCVSVNGSVLMPTGFPGVTARVALLGYKVVPLEMSEFRKMDGGLSCLSIRVP